MSTATKPPFRADHVGSLLRPPELLAAREQRQQGEITAPQLREAEDEAIRRAVVLQEDVGLKSITDGEFRRTMFHVDFLEQLEGVAFRGRMPVKFHTRDSGLEMAPPRLEVTGKLRHARPIQASDFDFLRSQTRHTPKVAIPSPTMLHFRGGRKGVDEAAYPSMEDFFGDLAAAYRAELNSLAERGCRYVQLDEVNLAFLCDRALREKTRELGEDPDALPGRYVKLINDSVRSLPEDMTVCVHLCRGNFQSAWIAEGGYEPVAEVLFNQLNVDGYFLEYDDERSGDIQPLRFLPKGKTVVLGLVSSKIPVLEPKDDLKRRIEEAGRYVDPDDLALSPQCGFASSVLGNKFPGRTKSPSCGW